MLFISIIIISKYKYLRMELYGRTVRQTVKRRSNTHSCQSESVVLSSHDGHAFTRSRPLLLFLPTYFFLFLLSYFILHWLIILYSVVYTHRLIQDSYTPTLYLQCLFIHSLFYIYELSLARLLCLSSNLHQSKVALTGLCDITWNFIA